MLSEPSPPLSDEVYENKPIYRIVITQNTYKYTQYCQTLISSVLTSYDI